MKEERNTKGHYHYKLPDSNIENHDLKSLTYGIYIEITMQINQDLAMIAYRMASRRCVATPFLRSERDTHIPRTPQTAGTPVLLHKMARPRSPWSLVCFFLRVTTSLVNFQSPKLSRVEGFSLSLFVWTKLELLSLSVSYLAGRSLGWDKTDGTTFRSVLSRTEALLGTNCVITVSLKEDVIDTSSGFWEGYVRLQLALDSMDFL